MVIKQIDVRGVLALELKYDPQITRYGHRPLSFAFAFQGMEPEAGQIHVGGFLADVQKGEYLLNFPNMLCGYPACIALCEQSLQPLMSKANDHLSPITLRVSHVKPFNTEPARRTAAFYRYCRAPFSSPCRLPRNRIFHDKRYSCQDTFKIEQMLGFAPLTSTFYLKRKKKT
ncbi:MAG: hypothetical protein P4L55_20510 [Syntrophobacteraceae bacterium]|nr:hypothetical protein [Syntrophobacteraceae bacterium]